MDLNKAKNEFPELRMVNDDIISNKVIDSQQYNNPLSKEGEAQYYQNTGRQFKYIKHK